MAITVFTNAFLIDCTGAEPMDGAAVVVEDEKIARAQTLLEPRARAEAYADLQKVVHDEAPWVFLWQQHDLYGVAQTIEWTPRADEKMWMYDAKVVAR